MTNLEHQPPPARHIALAMSLFLSLTVAAAIAQPASAQDPFIDAVISFSPGTAGGFNAAALPGVVLGPPRGGGPQQGSSDVASLGSGGSIVLHFDVPVICDGPGPDFTVFENAFHSGSLTGPVFTEYGYVAVSQDGVTFTTFPYDAGTHAGLAGQTAVLSNPDNDIDPLDPAVSGGDAFDLATVGLSWVSYVRITDVAGAIPDTGDLPQFAVPPSAGFDLDAIAALHGCDPAMLATATPTATATPAAPTTTASATATVPPGTATSSPTATAAAPPSQHDAVVAGRRPLRLHIRQGHVDATKRLRIAVRNADLAGEVPVRLSATACAGATVSIDFDRRAAGAQDTTMVRAGSARAARVSVTIPSDAVTTPDRRVPTTCVLTFAASADVAGNVDPHPDDNTTDVIVSVVDLNDVP